MFLKENGSILLFEFIVEKFTFFIKSNPKLLTRFGGLTLFLITLTVILNQVKTQLTQINREINSQIETEKEILVETFDESEDLQDSCLILAKILPPSLNRKVDFNQQVVVTRDSFQYHPQLLKGTLGNIIGIKDETQSLFVVEFFFDNMYSLDPEIDFIMPFLILDEKTKEKSNVSDKQFKKSAVGLIVKVFKVLKKELIETWNFKLKEKK